MLFQNMYLKHGKWHAKELGGEAYMSKSLTAKEGLVTSGKGMSKSLEAVTALLAENPLLLGCSVLSLHLPAFPNTARLLLKCTFNRS